MATVHMFRRLSRLTLKGSLPYRDRPSCCWGTNWSGHSSQGQVSLVALMPQGDQRAHGTIQPTNNHQRAGYRPEQNTTRARYRGQGRGGLVAPILVLPMRRDARYERPHALCERHRALLEHGCVLGPSVALRWWRGGAC